MKFTTLIVLFSAFVAVYCRPANSDATIVSQMFNMGDSAYEFGFEGSDQTKQEVSATLMNAGTDTAYYAVKGSYKYVDPDGQTVEVFYTADENGFRPEGTIIHSAISGAAKAVSSGIVGAASESRSVKAPAPKAAAAPVSTPPPAPPAPAAPVPSPAEPAPAPAEDAPAAAAAE